MQEHYLISITKNYKAETGNKYQILLSQDFRSDHWEFLFYSSYFKTFLHTLLYIKLMQLPFFNLYH